MDSVTPDLRQSKASAVDRDISAPLAAARARLAALPGSQLTFGVIRLWPDQPVAEHENVERLAAAARLIGARLIELDRDGRMLNSPGEFASSAHVDFVLHLHYETAKTYDAVSIGALWNPLAFYIDWGFGRFWANQMSHDLFATTGAPEIESLIRCERGEAAARAMPVLNHSLSAPILAPVPRDRYRAFYCGINWERVDGRAGRHGEVLSGLDALDKLDLYGPETLKGVKVWEGYRNYRGSLPFDGQTVIRRIWDAGACLVLSSEAHKASGIMSNRLFEAMAGGAVVIGDEHPFIAEAVGNHYVCVPSHLPAARRCTMIAEALADLERDPAAAAAMARAAQDRLIDRYLLSTQLAGLFEAAHRCRRARQADRAAPMVDIVIQPLPQEAPGLIRRIETMAADFGSAANLIVLAPEPQFDWFTKRLRGKATILAFSAPGAGPAPPADCLDALLPHLKGSKVGFLLGTETVFADAYLAACRQLDGRRVGRIGHALAHVDRKGRTNFDYCSPQDPIELLHPASVGAIVFDRAWLAGAPRLRGLSWRGLARIAELAEDCVATASPTAIIVDIRAYEQAAAAGNGWAEEIKDEAAIVHRFGALRGISAEGAVLCRTDAAPRAGQEDLARAFHRLPPDDKLKIGLDIYHAVKLPRWIKRPVRMMRRALRIQ